MWVGRDLNQNSRAPQGLHHSPHSPHSTPFSFLCDGPMKPSFFFFLVTYMSLPQDLCTGFPLPGTLLFLLYLVNSNSFFKSQLASVSREITKSNLSLRGFYHSLCSACLGSTLAYVGVVSYHSSISNFPPPFPTIDYMFYKIRNRIYVLLAVYF